MTTRSLLVDLGASREVCERLGVPDRIKNDLAKYTPLEVWAAEEYEDKMGVDYWALFNDQETLPRLPGVDVKLRARDCAKYGKDDVAIETWSVVGESPGWIARRDAWTDYVYWFWTDSHRSLCIDFHRLHHVWNVHGRDWQKRFRVHRQWSTYRGQSYQSEHIYVPVKTIAEVIKHELQLNLF